MNWSIFSFAQPESKFTEENAPIIY